MKFLLIFSILVGVLGLSYCADSTTEEPNHSSESSEELSHEESATGDESETLIPTKSPEEIRSQIQHQFLALTNLCKNSTKINAEQAKIASNQIQVPRNELERCFLQCMYDGLGLTKEGKFNVEGATKLAERRFGHNEEELEKANTLINNCSTEINIDTDEKCAIGRLVRECLIKHGEQLDFFPKP